MILVTLQRMLPVAYLSCLNYSYYTDFWDEYFFGLCATFKKINSFLVIICMTVHRHISSYKLFMFLMLRIVNWQMISNLDHVIFFLPLDWITITFSEPEKNIKYSIHARLHLWEYGHFPGRNIYSPNLYLDKNYLPVCFHKANIRMA